MSASIEQAEALQHAGQHDAAIACYREILREQPQSVRGRFGLALALMAQRQFDQAAELMVDVPVMPQAAEIYFHLGMGFFAQHRSLDATEWFNRALAARPDYPYAELHLGLALQNQGLLGDAIARYQRVLDGAPGEAGLYQNIALLQQMLGRHDQASAVYRRGIATCPDDPDLPRYLVSAMFYGTSASNQERFAVAREYGARLDRVAATRARPMRLRDSEKRLRLGYLTSDFRDHPIGRNVEPLLAHRDRGRFEVTIYANVAEPDAATAHLRTLADGWRDIAGQTDEAVAGLVEKDGIDILVCLAAHFDRNRPGVCAFRPAPVQVSFHDVTTSGSEVFDYLLADRIVVPRPPAEGFTERVFRLPGIYVHAPIDVPPPRPAQAGRPMTFGCLNNPAKLNGAILAIWARILSGIPGSRLVLKYQKWFRAPEIQARVTTVFAALGIAAERIDFLGSDDDRAAHLAHYDSIDVVLDPYPFSGSTATFEALWMGVPVVTLAGQTMMSRWSSSMLHALRLDGLIARTPEQYVAIAQHVAADARFRAAMRADLREMIRRSPLCNGALRARQAERAYRAMWRRWCRAG